MQLNAHAGTGRVLQGIMWSHVTLKYGMGGLEYFRHSWSPGIFIHIWNGLVQKISSELFHQQEIIDFQARLIFWRLHWRVGKIKNKKTTSFGEPGWPFSSDLSQHHGISARRISALWILLLLLLFIAPFCMNSKALITGVYENVQAHQEQKIESVYLCNFMYHTPSECMSNESVLVYSCYSSCKINISIIIF